MVSVIRVTAVSTQAHFCGHRTPELYHQSYANNARYRESLASISVIKGAGHYVRTSRSSTSRATLIIVVVAASRADAKRARG